MAASSEKKSSETGSGLQPPLSLDKVTKAAAALVEFVKKKGSNDLLLGDEGVKIGLQLSFKKAPKAKNKCIKIGLPHPLNTPTTDVCLFVKDLDPKKREYEDTIDFFKDLLAEKGVKMITNIIPVKSLKTEYKQYEAKRNLSNMYDIYLADARIVGILPKMLGKHFYGRRRHPIQVNLLATNLSAEIDKVVNNARLHLNGRGSSCMATVARSSMSVDEIAENALAAANCVAERIPGGPENVQQFFLSTPGAPAIPIYLTADPGNNVVLPVRKKVVIDEEAEEVTTVEGAKVKITKGYNVVLIPDDGEEIKEVKHDKRKRKNSGVVDELLIKKDKISPVKSVDSVKEVKQRKKKSGKASK